MTHNASNDDGADVIELARAVGLTGIRPAREGAPQITGDRADRSEPSTIVDDGSDIVALARTVGLYGIAPATDPTQPAQPENTAKTVTSTLAHNAAKISPVAAGAGELFAEFQLFGGTGWAAKHEWEKRHGNLAANAGSGEYWLERKSNVSTHILFRVPDNNDSRNDTRRAAGNIERCAGFRLTVLRDFDRSAYQLKGPGAAAAAANGDCKPPILPAHVIAALTRS